MNTRLRFLRYVCSSIALAAAAFPARAELPHNELPHNSISLEGLAKAAPFLDALANGPLSDATLSAVVATPSASAASMKLLDKIVSCALDPGVKRHLNGHEFEGELGVCGSHSPFGDWATASLLPARKQKCLEIVSSCVLALVNAKGARVVISVRARSPRTMFPLLNRVPVETKYRAGGAPIPSLESCSATHLPPDCGFQPGSVGRCVAGKEVKVVAKPAGANIRVCKGIYGCDTGTPVPAYTGLLREGVGTLVFACPRNGPRVQGEHWGYYSILTGPTGGTRPASVKATSPRGAYPAKEKDVFTWPEGAFYGNLFDTARNAESLSSNVRETGASGKEQDTQGTSREGKEKTLGGDQHACFSPVWADGVAQMNDRFCAIPNGFECFANKPMPCSRRFDDRCRQNALAGRAVANCAPTSSTTTSAHAIWTLPITTYLNNPCDLSAKETCDPDRVITPPPPDDDDREAERQRAEKAERR